ncbi:hypothetical protein ACE10Z_23660 [Bradyrhizobium sp. Pha-3]|uniref:hypothetical protein n=1 Tax=Bradyrhizobium sp. Pha-3 TaxID=208375 RepID=UPI0035D4FFFE
MAVVDIRDILPGKGEVTIGESIVEVRGLSLHSFAETVAQFPEIIAYLDGGSISDPTALLASVPDAALALMACGIGKPGDAEIIGILKVWELPQQTDLLTGVLDRTFKGSARPFVQALLVAAVRAARSSSAQPQPETSAPSSQPSSNS